MKKALIISLILPALFISLVACDKSGGAPGIADAAVVKPATPDTSTPATSGTSGAQKLTYKVGPFSLPAGQKAMNMWEAPGSINFQTDEPLWITSFENSIEDGNGGELPANLLHMAIVSNASEKNPLCADKEVANPFLAATATTRKIELPDGHGYPVLATDQLDAKVMLQNPGTQDYENVYFKFTITAVPMKSAKNFKDVMPLLLDVDPCDHQPMMVSPKEFVKKDASFKVPEAGLLIKAYGLLQDSAIEISLKAKNQPLWDAKPTLSADHKIESLADFADPAGIPLAKGDALSLEVAYDNSADGWQDAATGAIMAYVTRTDDSSKNSKETATTSTTNLSATDTQKALLKN